MRRGVQTMKRGSPVLGVAVLMTAGFCTSAVHAQTARWPEQKANTWYAQQPWLVGSNYVPKSAINQLEMWQEETFDPDQIEKEFTWAEAMGMNTMRVFLHDLLWEQDARGFQKRMDRFLAFRPGIISVRCWCCSIRAGTRCRIWACNIHRFLGFTIPAGRRVLEQRRLRTQASTRD